jgi:hypothetical protein
LANADIIFPIKQYDKKGQSTDQPLSSLESLEQYADNDNWDSYIEFHPDQKKYKGIFVFQAPLTDMSTISSITLLANYRGAESYYQKWRIKLRDFQARKWVTLADNSEALSWQWYQMNALITQNPQRFINNKGQLKLLYWSNNSNDASQLDYLALDIKSPPPTNETTWWQPSPGLSWQIQYAGTPTYSIDVDVYNIDLFDSSAAEIAALKSPDKHIICYFSAGSIEDWRSDVNTFPNSVIGNDYQGWAGEAWLDIRRLDILLPIMQARIELAADKGCDAVDPDNINAYTNNTGFDLSYADQINYNKALAELAPQSNLAIGLKNDIAQINDLLTYFDFAVNESCFQYDECDLLSPFIQMNKAVFAIDYNSVSDGFCAAANRLNFDGLKKNWDLDAWLYSCR